MVVTFPMNLWMMQKQIMIMGISNLRTTLVLRNFTMIARTLNIKQNMENFPALLADLLDYHHIIIN
jgi:DNA anti-recombination protein RmuC